MPTLTERRPSLAGGSPSRIVRHLHRRFISSRFPLVRGNMATPAAVNPSGKSAPRVSPVSVFATFSHHIRAKNEPSVFVRGCCCCCGGGGLKRRQAAAAWLPASIPLPPTRRAARFARNAAILYISSVYTSARKHDLVNVAACALFCVTPSPFCSRFCFCVARG